MTETQLHRPDPDYPATEYRYDTDAPLGLAALWVDVHGSAWLESKDGNRVQVPNDIRPLIAKRIREARYR